MKTRLILLSLAVSGVLLVSCNKGNEAGAAAKINKAKLESAKERDALIGSTIPVASFDQTEYDFGTVKEGDIVETTFKVTNTGKGDLIITNAGASCGCTVPKWPKEPIKPGATADIEVKFNTAGKPNKQIKTVTLYTNTANGREVLKVKGNVISKNKVVSNELGTIKALNTSK